MTEGWQQRLRVGTRVLCGQAQLFSVKCQVHPAFLLQRKTPHCRGKHSLSSSCFGATLLLVTVLPGVREMLRFFKKHILNLCPESPTCFERLLARTVHAGMNYEVTQGHKCILLCDFYLYPFSSTWELMGVSPADF